MLFLSSAPPQLILPLKYVLDAMYSFCLHCCDPSFITTKEKEEGGEEEMQEATASLEISVDAAVVGAFSKLAFKEEH